MARTLWQGQDPVPFVIVALFFFFCLGGGEGARIDDHYLLIYRGMVDSGPQTLRYRRLGRQREKRRKRQREALSLTLLKSCCQATQFHTDSKLCPYCDR
jgi:hypothetical protein